LLAAKESDIKKSYKFEKNKLLRVC